MENTPNESCDIYAWEPYSETWIYLANARNPKLAERIARLLKESGDGDSYFGYGPNEREVSEV